MSEHESDLQEKIELLSLNSLSYETPTSVASVSSRVRTQINMNPNQLIGYGAGDQLQIVINSGAAYTNGNTSTINFALRVNGPAGVGAFSFGLNGADSDGDTFYNSGASILNIFSDTLLNARSGELLVREQYRAQYASAIMHYNGNFDMRQMWGALGGASLTTGDDGKASMKFPIYPTNRKIYFSIPLPLISSFFSSQALIPPQLLSGALLKLMLGDVKSAIKLYTTLDGTAFATAPNAAQVSVDILDASIYLDQSTLFDSTSAMINAAASSLESSGLSYSYETYLGFRYPVSQNGSTINLDVLLSAAKVDKCIVKIVNAAGSTAAWISAADRIGCASWQKSAGSDGVNVNKIGSNGGYQFRLGNETFPLYMVNNTVDAFNQVVEAFQMGGFVWDDVDPLKTVNKPVNLGVSYQDYYRLTANGSAGAGTGCNIIVQSLNKSQILNVSGVSTNNSRQLTVLLNDFQYLSNCVVYVYVPFLAVANASIDNCVVNR